VARPGRSRHRFAVSSPENECVAFSTSGASAPAAGHGVAQAETMTLARLDHRGLLPAVDVIRRSERVDPLSERKLRALITAGDWTRVAPGAFVRTADRVGLKPRQQHVLRVLEITRRLRSCVVIARYAAAAVHGIDILGAWPTTVDVLRPPAGGGRSSGWIRRHPTNLDAVAVEPFGEHLITTPAQTALDLARTLPFAGGAAVVDQAIWTQRSGGALTTPADLHARSEADPDHRGYARALRAIDFANPRAANVRETQSRVVIAQLGFPAPRIQECRTLRSGRLVFGDFYFPSHDHWGEFDGHGKYLDPEFDTDRDAAAHVIEEKNRENEIRREVRGFSRWEPADVDTPVRLYDILTGDGLPSSLPRPRTGS